MPSPAGDTGEQPTVEKPRRRFVLWDWNELLPMIARLTVLVGVAVLGVNSQTANIAEAQLKAEENAAGTQEVRAAGTARLEEEYNTMHEMIRYHMAQEAGCDSALESYARHMDDLRDWEHVVEKCHSKGAIE